MKVTAQKVYEVFRDAQLLLGTPPDGFYVTPPTWEAVAIEDKERFAIMAIQLNLLAIPIAPESEADA